MLEIAVSIKDKYTKSVIISKILTTYIKNISMSDKLKIGSQIKEKTLKIGQQLYEEGFTENDNI